VEGETAQVAGNHNRNGNLGGSAIVSTGTTAPAQAQPRRAHTVSVDRRRHSRDGADRRCDRRGRLRAERVAVGAGDRKPASDHRGGSSQVYAADGTRLGFIQSDQLRTPVSWSDIPANLRNATVAIEDQRFYKNNGVDLTGIFRAAVKDITHGKALQGGSTITMQLVRNLYLGGDQHTLKQKIIEAKLAIEYEKRHDKHSILTSYPQQRSLRHARRADGDRRAGGFADLLRQTRFAVEPGAVGNCWPACRRRPLNTTPFAMRPWPSAGATRCCRRWTNCTTSARRRPPPPRRPRWKSSAATSTPERKEDFFFEYVRQQLVKRYGASTVAQGGLKVHTTIDLNMQSQARKAIASVLNEPEDPAAAIVTIDPANGNIEAMAGVPELRGIPIQPRTRRANRQPGSTFKAIVLADALSRGIDPNSTYYDSQHALSRLAHRLSDLRSQNLRRRAERHDKPRAGNAQIRQHRVRAAGGGLGRADSHRNGPQDGRRQPPAQLCRGGARRAHARLFTPLEMANVYATLADGGWRNSPIAITKVVFPDGHGTTTGASRIA